MRTLISLFVGIVLLNAGVISVHASAAQPVCEAIGSRSEGWRRGPSGDLITYASCSTCRAECRSAGTAAEGWYSTCDSGLIEYALCGSVSGLPQFIDTERTHENYDAIMYVRAKGYVQGYDDGTFRPMQRVTRAEFTKILIAATVDPINLETCLVDTPSNYRVFSDVPPGVWYENHLCVAKNTGVIGGYNDGTFHPNSSISFAEASKILVKTLGLSDPAAATLPTEAWYKKYVLVLQVLHAIPMSINRMDHSVTRGELAEMLYRVQAKVNSKPSQTFAGLMSVQAQSSAADTSLCTAPAEIMASGKPRFPVAPQYQSIAYLGQFFTAADCGSARLTQMVGTTETQYQMGSRLSLKQEPTPDFKKVLMSVGYRCASASAPCTEWKLAKTVSIEQILRLRPFANQIASDDCIFCG